MVKPSERPHYNGHAETWRDVYRSADPFGRRIQRRRDAVVAAVQREMGSHRGAILDAGCGTGEVTRRLQTLGHSVIGLDLSADMLLEGYREAGQFGLPPSLTRGSVLSLPFPSASFDAVVCVGVLSYLHCRREGNRVIDEESAGLRELARVLKPQGFLVVTLSNLLRVHWLLDPVRLKAGLAQWRSDRAMATTGRKGRDEPTTSGEPRTRYRTRAAVRGLMHAHGLRIKNCAGIGFGPFTVFGRHPLAFERSVRISEGMERIARRRALRPLNWLAATWVLTLEPRSRRAVANGAALR